MDSILPVNRSKNNFFALFGVVIVLLLISGVAFTSFYVSNRLASTSGVTPNAPASEPKAAASECKTDADCGKQQACVNKKCSFHGTPTPTKTPCDRNEPGCFKCDPNVCKNGYHCTVENGYEYCRAEGGTSCKNSNECVPPLICDPKLSKCTGGDTTPTPTPKLYNCFKDPCGGNQCCKTDNGKTEAGYCTTCTGKIDEIVCGRVTCDGMTERCCPSGCKPKSSACGPDVTPTPTPSPTPTPTPTVGRCISLKAYKPGTSGTAPILMTPTQLANLKVNNEVLLACEGSLPNLEARFSISIDGGANAQFLSTGYLDSAKMISTYKYKVLKTGKYIFNAQVSSRSNKIGI